MSRHPYECPSCGYHPCVCTEGNTDPYRRSRAQAIADERENREAWRIEREKLARADREDIPTD